jgi:3-oxoacyl-[acyl-carrier-protein] synthase I
MQQKSSRQTAGGTHGGRRAYLAGIGMITPVGFNADMTAASVGAGLNQYALSERFFTAEREPVSMASVPEQVFEEARFDIEEGSYYGERYDRTIKMAIIAALETLADCDLANPVPLILALPEPLPDEHAVMPGLLRDNLVRNLGGAVSGDNCRSIHTGRSAGIEVIDLALRYLYELGTDCVLVGGSDTHHCYPRLNPLDEAGRLLAPGSMDGFAPGEGAGFLLLTRDPGRALVRNDRIVAVREPGSGLEPGHLSSESPCLGDGLDQAFKGALRDLPAGAIDVVYSSMNGESHWAREFGVARLRNCRHFRESAVVEHPADCYGDLGAATGPVLMGLAALDLMKRARPARHLVCCSSDHTPRAAVIMESVPVSAAERREVAA